MTMRTRLCPLFVLLVIACGEAAAAQALNVLPGPETDSMDTPGHLQRHRAAVFRQQADPLFGFLLGVARDTLVLQSVRQREKVRLNELTMVTVMPEQRKGKIAAYGMLLGIYLGNLAFYQAEGQPTAYYAADTDDNVLGEILANVLFAAAGVGLGYLYGMGLERDRTFLFTGSQQHRRATLGRIGRFVSPKPHAQSVHFSVQGGHVFTQTSDRSEDALRSAGFRLHSYSDRRSDFNLLRKLELTYSVRPKVQVGLARLWMGEPALWGWKPYWQVRQSYDASGYYIIGKYVWTRLSSSPTSTQFFAGGGFGVASIDFNLTAQGYDSQIREYVTVERRIDRNPLGGFAYVGVNLFATGTLSFGIVADYILGPSYEVAEIPEADLGGQKIRVGNPSVGFSLGIHL